MLINELWRAQFSEKTNSEKSHDKVIELAQDRDEVRDDIQRHGQVQEQYGQYQLGKDWYTGIGQETPWQPQFTPQG